MTTETDTLYSSLGEAERYAKELEGKLEEAKILIKHMHQMLWQGRVVFGSAGIQFAIEESQNFLSRNPPSA